MEEEKDRLHNILQKNKDDSLSPNINMIIIIVTIEEEME